MLMVDLLGRQGYLEILVTIGTENTYKYINVFYAFKINVSMLLINQCDSIMEYDSGNKRNVFHFFTGLT